MKRNVATFVLGAMTMLLTLAPNVVSAATPTPTSAMLITRYWNDCPVSTLGTVNAYPGSISISDLSPGCLGYANLHLWRFSTDGTTAVPFDNNASYSFGADVNAGGAGECEAGLQIVQWFPWSEDGFFNIRTTDGEIACFAGRLPFYSFTGSQGLHYVKGTTVHMEMVYSPNGLSAISPGTVEYRYTDGAGLHTSGALPFDEGNVAEGPVYGNWGQENLARVGGHFKYFVGLSPNAQATVTWNQITYSNNDQATPARRSTWGTMKALYR